MTGSFPSTPDRCLARWHPARLGALLPAGLLWSLSALPSACLSFEGDVTEIVVTRHALEFQGVAALGRRLQGEQTQSFELLEARVPQNVDADLRPTQLTVSLFEGVIDLSFITGLEVTLSCPGSEELPEFVLFVLEESVALGTTAFQLDPVERPNVVDYLRCPTARYSFTVRGSLPDEDWAIDTGVGFSGAFSVSP